MTSKSRPAIATEMQVGITPCSGIAFPRVSLLRDDPVGRAAAERLAARLA